MQKSDNGNFISNVIKGVLTAIIVTLVGVMAFSFVVKTALLQTGAIKAVNQFIKILSIFLACSFSIKGGLGLLKGAIIGALSIALTFLLFALFGASVSFGFSFILELIFGVIVGGISGIISVNIKKRS